MISVAYIYRVDPKSDTDVKQILTVPQKEILYNTNYGAPLHFYVKEIKEKKEWIGGVACIDYMRPIRVYTREKDQIKVEEKQIKDVSVVRYALFPEIRGSDTLTNVVAILSPVAQTKLLADSISKIVGRLAFLKVEFSITFRTEDKIKNEFDDIVKLSADVTDDRLKGLSIKGVQLFQTPEYKRALSQMRGVGKIIGVELGGKWFLINRKGLIFTYQPLDEEEFIWYVKEIVRKMLKSEAIYLP